LGIVGETYHDIHLRFHPGETLCELEVFEVVELVEINRDSAKAGVDLLGRCGLNDRRSIFSVRALQTECYLPFLGWGCDATTHHVHLQCDWIPIKAHYISCVSSDKGDF